MADPYMKSNAKPDVKQHPMAQWDLLYKIKTKTQKYEDISDIYEGNREYPVDETVQAIDNIKNEDGIPVSIIALLRELNEAQISSLRKENAIRYDGRYNSEEYSDSTRST